MGSSPHTRGAHVPWDSSYRDIGIIPAYAGSTHCIQLNQSTYWDHPRIRGEHYSVSRFVNAVMGSSPHTRGALNTAFTGMGALGIIPAYAGSTRKRERLLSMIWDHPRIRGEHNNGVYYFHNLAGSSPHTRGAPGITGSTITAFRIIPAYAGSTPIPPLE